MVPSYTFQSLLAVHYCTTKLYSDKGGGGRTGPVIDHVSRSQYIESVSPVTGLYPGQEGR